jgi:hypothetical protein
MFCHVAKAKSLRLPAMVAKIKKKPRQKSGLFAFMQSWASAAYKPLLRCRIMKLS